MSGEQYATVKEAAERLGVSTGAVRSYERRGILPPALRSPINGYRLWRRDELIEACARLQPRRTSEVPA